MVWSIPLFFFFPILIVNCDGTSPRTRAQNVLGNGIAHNLIYLIAILSQLAKAGAFNFDVDPRNVHAQQEKRKW